MTLLISRAGIAAAARVQRPVVTMWQRRTSVRGELIPFPAPVVGGELFDLDQVIAWQAATGRGNNASFAEDAPLHAAVPGGGDALDAMLTLAAVTDIALTESDPDELMTAAIEVDPSDTTLLREIRAMAQDAELRELADRMIDAAYGASAAVEKLAAERARAGEERRWSLADPVVDLVRLLGESVSPSSLSVSDGDPGSPGDLALRVALADAERATAWAPPSGDGTGRRLRRRALAARLPVPDPEARPLRVVQVPSRGHSSDPTAVLRPVDELVLSLAPGEVAVVVGPAGVLCDELTGRDDRLARADVLRTGRLRAAVRLPAGLVVDKPRAELGLWLLGDADEQAAVGERLLVTGEISRTDLTGSAMHGLVADLVAALGGVAQIRARAFAHCHPERTARLLATDAALVPRPAARVGNEPAGATAVTALTAWERATEHGLAGAFTVMAAETPDPGHHLTLEQLVASGAARVLPGSRVPAEQRGEGPVRVIGPDEVLGRGPGAALDALTAHAVYRLTEPGDVVFVTRPRPRAVVDEEGGSVVAAPARVLRLRTGSPFAVVAAINALPADADRPHSWSVPIPAPSATATLDSALRSLDERRRALQEELALLGELEIDLVEGVTDGALIVRTREKE